MTVSDQQIGANVARLRGSVSQTLLANLMRELGYRWSQTTVWMVEKGDRPLRLGEAEALASAFSALREEELTALDLLVEEGSPQIRGMLRRVAREYSETRDSVLSFEATQTALRVLAEAEDENMTEEQRETTQAWLDVAVIRSRRFDDQVKLSGEHPEA